MVHEKHSLSQPGKKRTKNLESYFMTQIPSTSAAVSANEETDDADEAMNEYETNELVAVVIQYLLMAQKNKKPVRMNNLKKIFPKTFYKTATKEVLQRAFDEMKKLFGIEVCEVNFEKGVQVIILKNSIADTLSAITGNDVDDKNKMDDVRQGILLATLMYLFMAKKPKSSSLVVTEAALFEFLESMGMHKSLNIDLKKLIEAKPTAEFVSEGWITYEKDSTKYGTETVFYGWGARAEACIDRKKLLELFCEIDGTKPEDWSDHIIAEEASS
uniref:MAGE domain-containing protein n=1 Tax=Syphacia muris TaxID=451379 RepID=A0A0N5A9H9_9BILA